jgi:hypothetical protein
MSHPSGIHSDIDKTVIDDRISILFSIKRAKISVAARVVPTRLAPTRLAIGAARAFETGHANRSPGSFGSIDRIGGDREDRDHRDRKPIPDW